MDLREERIRLAKEIGKINKQLMLVGSIHYKERRELEAKRDELEKQRLATFKSVEEYNEFKKNLNKDVKPVWSGCYTDYIGWGSQVPMEYKNGEMVYGYPEYYDYVEPEWRMKFDTEALNIALLNEKYKK